MNKTSKPFNIHVSGTDSNSRTRGVKADRNLLAQLCEIDQILFDFESNQTNLKQANAMAATENSSPPPGQRKFFDLADLEIRKKWIRTLSGDARKTIDASLKVAVDLGNFRSVAMAPLPGVLDQLLVDFPNFSEVTRLIQMRLTLCRCAPERVIRLPPILLAGPPGVGKTAYSKRVAKILGVNFTEIDGATMTASFSVTGLDSGYSNCRPGLIWEALNKQDGCMSSLILIDEIDKARHSSGESYLGFLYTLLERATAQTFQDGAMLLPVDASYLLWIATCNETSGIDPALLSRFEVIHIDQPTDIQMQAVVGSIHRELFATAEWSCAFDVDIPAGVVQSLSRHSPRLIRRTLEDAYAVAALARRRSLTLDDLKQLGSRTQASQRNPIGFVNTN